MGRSKPSPTPGAMLSAWAIRSLLRPPLVAAVTGYAGCVRRTNSRELLRARGAEAFKAFGNPTVFLEQLMQGARHVEVQIIADHYGTTWAAGVRDCPIQERHQNILEEAPSPRL